MATEGFDKLFGSKGAGERYDESCRTSDYATPRVMRSELLKTLKTLSLPSPKDIVMFGVGTGLDAEALIEQFPNAKTTAADLYEEMGKLARNRGVNKVIIGDVTQELIEIERGAADLVTAFGISEFLTKGQTYSLAEYNQQRISKISAMATQMERAAKHGALLAITWRPFPEEGDDVVRTGYANFTLEEVIDAFPTAVLLSDGIHTTYSMPQQPDQESRNDDGKMIDVPYGHAILQMPEVNGAMA